MLTIKGNNFLRIVLAIILMIISIGVLSENFDYQKSVYASTAQIPELVILETNNAPKLRGWAGHARYEDFDGSWRDAPVNYGGFLYGHTNEVDFDVKFQILHTQNKIYLRILVADDVIKNDAGEDWWNDDSIEIYIDGNNSWGNTYDGVNDRQIVFRLRDQQVKISGPPMPISDWDLFPYSAGRYELTAEFDKAALGIIGNEFGFDIQVNDDDWGTRQSKWAWAGIDDTSYQNPQRFGKAILKPFPNPPPPSPLSSTWKQIAKILPPNDLENGSQFGSSVSIQDDTLVVGAPLADSGNITDTGKVYVYSKDGQNFDLKHTLTLTNPTTNDRFGQAVSLNQDRVAIGAPGKFYTPIPPDESSVPCPPCWSNWNEISNRVNTTGHVYLFDRNSTSQPWVFRNDITYRNLVLVQYLGYSRNLRQYTKNFGQYVKLVGTQLLVEASLMSKYFLYRLDRTAVMSNSVFSDYDHFGERGSSYEKQYLDLDIVNNRFIYSTHETNKVAVGPDSITKKIIVNDSSRNNVEIPISTNVLAVSEQFFAYLDSSSSVAPPKSVIRDGNGVVQELPAYSKLELGNQLLLGIEPTFNNKGAIFIYRYDGTIWQNDGRIEATDVISGDGFATAVALTNDIVVIGAPTQGERGVVYVYQRLGNITPNTPTPPPSPSTCTANQLTNPNFTSDMSGWNRWDNSSSAVNGKLQTVGAGGIGQHKAASAGQSYTLKASSGSSGNASLGLNFYDAGWNLLSRVSAEAGGANATRTVQATAPANTALVEAWVWNSSGTLSADDFCLTGSGGGNPTVTPTPTPLVTPSPTALITPSSTPTPVPVSCANNALANGGFENDFANWQRWDTASSIGSDAKAGSKALRIGPSAGGIGQHLAVTPGANVSLSAWSKLANGGSGRIGLTFFNAQWQQVGSNIYADVSSAGYTRHDLSATVPAGASIAQVWAYKSGTSGEQWLDEVCLQGAATAASTGAAARMVAPGRWVADAASASRAIYLPLTLRK